MMLTLQTLLWGRMFPCTWAGRYKKCGIRDLNVHERINQEEESFNITNIHLYLFILNFYLFLNIITAISGLSRLYFIIAISQVDWLGRRSSGWQQTHFRYWPFKSPRRAEAEPSGAAHPRMLWSHLTARRRLSSRVTAHTQKKPPKNPNLLQKGNGGQPARPPAS